MKMSLTLPEQEIVEYPIEPRLKKNLAGIRDRILNRDKDYVMVIDGGEGTGKSTLAIQIGKYVDPSLILERISFTGEKFKEAILSAKKGQCVIYDEAITGLSSTQSLSKINNMLKSLMMQMRQKNLLVIVVIPTIFALDKYVAIFRARVLIHTYETPKKMGYFKVYNNRYKKILYLTCKKTYDYTKINPYFKGRFYKKFALGTASEIEYRKLKALALQNAEIEDFMDKSSKTKEILCRILHFEFKKTVKEILELFDKYNLKISQRQIYRYIEKE